MQYCPNCSAQLDDDALECHNCGAQFQPRSHGRQRQPPQGDHHQQDQQGNRGQQGPRNQQPQQGGGQHRQQQPPHGAQQPPGQRPPPEQRQQHKVGPLTRRQALAVGGGIAVMIGAWALGVTGSSSDNPERVVRDYLDAVEARDPDAASTLVHQDSPAQDELVTPLSGAAGESSEDELQVSITVEETEVVDRESDPAREGVQEFTTVETTITTTIESADTSETNTNTVQFRLARNSAGTWKLWDVSTTSTTVDDATPAVSFDFDYAPGSSGPGDGVLTITHSSGETIKASELFVRGSGVNRVGTDPMAGFSQRFDRISTDLGRTSSVSAGVRVRLEADSDYQVTVVWEGDPAGTLGEASGPDA